MMKILIAHDGSADADGALRDLAFAGLPAKAEALVVTIASLHLPFGIESQVSMGWSAPYAALLDTATKEAETQANKVAAGLRTRFPGWKIKAEAGMGEPVAGILEKAERWKPDLVIAGSHGRTALGRMLMGSVSRGLLHHVPSAVRITRPRLRGKSGPPRIVVAVDGSRGSEAALRAVAEREWPKRTEVLVAGAMKARKHRGAFLSGADPEALERLEELGRSWLERRIQSAAIKLSEAGLDVSTEIFEGDPRDVLVREAKAWLADCIFLGSRGLGTLDRLVLGSVSDAVASHAPCTVEVVRARRAASRRRSA